MPGVFVLAEFIAAENLATGTERSMPTQNVLRSDGGSCAVTTFQIRKTDASF